jgi:hypothetical protein
MHCEECGQTSDWIGDGSHWNHVAEGGATVPLLECDVCGNRKRAR